MAIAIFDKTTKLLNVCLETASQVSELNLNNSDWWINVEISDADWLSINAGTKVPESLDDSNNIVYNDVTLTNTLGIESFKSHRDGLINVLNDHLNSQTMKTYSGRAPIQAYRDWLVNLNIDNITFPIEVRFEDWVTSQGGTPVLGICIP
jgi:hypothetical protein|tara:strand:+ start:1764 stop:2213 length:450 start_codon:yes stop_codon:yes gene_type:complete